MEEIAEPTATETETAAEAKAKTAAEASQGKINHDVHSSEDCLSRVARPRKD